MTPLDQEIDGGLGRFRGAVPVVGTALGTAQEPPGLGRLPPCAGIRWAEKCRYASRWRWVARVDGRRPRRTCACHFGDVMGKVIANLRWPR